jgi:putative DNA primase/helicase
MNTKRYELKVEPFQLGPIEFQDGLYCVTTDKGQDDVWSRIGAPLWVIASGSDTAGLGWGIQVNWYSPDGRPQEAFIRDVHLLSDGREALMKLMDGGYRFNLGMKRQLIDYLNSKPTNNTRIRHDRLGWIPDTNNFMFGDGAVGYANAVKYIYTGHTPIQSDVAGTLDEWRDEVAALCLGNSRLLLSTSLAFAGPLLRLTNQSSFGVHLVGPSSIGKSTAMLVAASVLGKPANKIQTWNATKVGLETTADLCNDSTLFLDEIGQADPHVLGDTIYMLANGEGRARANADLSRRAKLQWRTTFLSNGEVDLEHSLASVGKRHKAGHDVRMINIEADTDRHGIFEELHGHPSGASLSKTLAERTTRYHGVAFRSFVEELTLDIDGAQAFVDEHRADMMRRLGTKECDGQVQRVADAFGLISAAGELANRFGITGWPAGSVAAVVEQLFRKWLARRGTRGSLEEANIIEQLVELLERRRGQFLADGPNVTKQGESYGYTTSLELHLYVDGFKQTFIGFNDNYVHKVLRKHGILTHGTGRDLPRHKKSRVYQLSLDKIADAHDRLLAEQGGE